MSCMTALVMPDALHSTMFQLLSGASGLFWMAAYALIIRRGRLDRSYGMPMVAVCVNISWEFIFSFIFPHEGVQLVINILWLLLDLVIFGQLLLYWRSDLDEREKAVFYPFIFGVLAASFGLIYSMALEFDHCGAYSAFGQNLLMSILFLHMLLQRNSLAGQSVYIGLGKMAGTALASLNAFLFVPLADASPVLRYLFIAILVFDLGYVLALLYVAGKQNIPVWNRF